MLFAGAIEFEFTPAEMAVILSVLLLSAAAYAAIGGAIASVVAGARGAFWLGCASCIATTAFVADDIDLELTVGAAWTSSALVGIALRLRRQRREPTDPDDQN